MKYSEHKQYYNENGDEVPSVTTIIALLNKPALSKWANAMGFRGKSIKEILDKASEIGTLMHDCLEKYFKGEKFILPEEYYKHKPTLLKRLDGFLSWLSTQNSLKPIMLEKVLTSDNFGGTMDFFGELNDENVILDFKTSGSVYATMFLQLAAYTIMMEEKGYRVDGVGIVHITEKGTTLYYKTRKELDKYIGTFKALATLFSLWYDVNIEDGWGNICEK